MYRKLLIMTCGLLISSSPVLADNTLGHAARDGQWSTVIAILDHNRNHYLLKTTVNDEPDACWKKLEVVATKVKQQTGVIWTNHAKSVVEYEKKPGAELPATVLELRCVLEPFSSELVHK